MPKTKNPKQTETTKTTKFRNWSFIMYPESFPDGPEWLLSKHLPVIISPLHDKDKNDDGTTKKPHYHVILKLDGPQTEKGVRTMLAMVPEGPDKRVVMLERVFSIQGAVRYLTHADDDDKYPYNIDDIRSNIEFKHYFAENTSSELDLLEVLDICFREDIFEVSKLLAFAYKTRNVALAEFIRKNTYTLKQTLFGFNGLEFLVDEELAKTVDAPDKVKASLCGFYDTEYCPDEEKANLIGFDMLSANKRMLHDYEEKLSNLTEEKYPGERKDIERNILALKNYIGYEASKK